MSKDDLKKKINKVSQKIAREFKPEKIILFGSWAWGKPHRDSDVDLFIIKKTKNTRKMAMEIDGSVFPRPFPMDIIVYEPKQVERRMKLGDFFIEDILTKGKILYEKS